MVYDASLRRVVLFGGQDQSTSAIYNDTWFYDGANWQPVAPASSPTPRYRMASAYDSVRLRTVLYGGFDGTNVLTDTYEFSFRSRSRAAPAMYASATPRASASEAIASPRMSSTASDCTP